MDAVVLMGGCDKTVPAQLMGAASAGVPAVQLVGGPMMTGRHRGERLGAWHRLPAVSGPVSRPARSAARKSAPVEGRLATTAGTCAVMGTASTMACIAEALECRCPAPQAIPAVHATAAGRRGERPDRGAAHPQPDLSSTGHDSGSGGKRAGGLACHRRIYQRNHSSHRHRRTPRARGFAQPSENELSDTTPVLVDLKPTGAHYMEDFYAAGGLSAVLRELKPLLHLDCISVTGETLAQRLDAEQAATWTAP